jgi:hypothetical protein
MKKLLNVLTILIFTVSSVSAETVLYCTTELATGMGYENGKWKTADFEPERFTVKYIEVKNNNKDEVHLTLKPSSYPLAKDFLCFRVNRESHLIICNNDNPEVLIYNPELKRFSYAQGLGFSYVYRKDGRYSDTQQIYSGTCTDF